MNTKFRYLRKAGALVAPCAALLPTASFAATDVALLPRNLSPWGMFLNADIVVKAVMVGLALASLLTWTVWLAKTIELGTAQRLARRRLKLLERGSLSEAARACDSKRDAVAQLVLSAEREAELSRRVVDDDFKER